MEETPDEEENLEKKWLGYSFELVLFSKTGNPVSGVSIATLGHINKCVK